MATQMDFPDRIEECVLDTDYRSSSPQNRTAREVLQILNEITTAARNLAKTLPSINKVLLMIETEQEEMDERARKAYERTDHMVQIQLSRLKLEFQSCTTKAKLFVYACVSMAKYGTNEEIKQILDRELQKKKIDSLQEFIKDVLRQLKLSSRRFCQFKDAHTEVQEKADRVMREYKLRATQNGASNGFWGSGIFATGVQYIQGIRNAGSTLTSYFSEDLGSDVDPPTKTEASPEQKIFHNAQVCVAELAKSMDRVTHQIVEIEAHTAQAKDNIDNLGEKCLDAHTEEALTDLLVANIKTDLSSFRDAMRKILDITGNDGERISSDPYQVISNTVAAQVSDDSGDSPNGQNPMDINLHTPTYNKVLPFGAEFVGPNLVVGGRLHPYHTVQGTDFEENTQVLDRLSDSGIQDEQEEMLEVAESDSSSEIETHATDMPQPVRVY